MEDLLILRDLSNVEEINNLYIYCSVQLDIGRNLFFKGKRFISDFSQKILLLPEKKDFKLFFNNIASSRRDIYKKIKNKSGVYLFINNITGDKYIGSSIILSRRMASHFYHGSIKLDQKNTKSILYRAMRKYKLENFSLAILEFCKSDTLKTAKLEQK
jgi:hypothetical protein